MPCSAEEIMDSGFAYLAKHPGVMDRIFEEVRDGLTLEGFPDGNVFERWPFTEAVVKEVR